MPWKPDRPCRHPGCPKLSQSGYCDEHSRPDERPNAGARGYDARWRKLRARWLRSVPLCEHCMRDGITQPAELVDHIIPIRAGGGRLDVENLQSLCLKCHAKKTAQDGKIYGPLRHW